MRYVLDSRKTKVRSGEKDEGTGNKKVSIGLSFSRDHSTLNYQIGRNCAVGFCRQC